MMSHSKQVKLVRHQEVPGFFWGTTRGKGKLFVNHHRFKKFDSIPIPAFYFLGGDFHEA